MTLDAQSGLRKLYSQARSTFVNFISEDDRLKTRGLVVILFILVFLATLIKATYITSGLIFGDETTYKVFSKYLPNYQSIVNQGVSFVFVVAPLYYKIYSICHSFGKDFYEIAKILNSLFFSLSVFPIYALACAFVRPRTALFICAAACTAPYGTFASYFMPESLYYFLFWMFVYVFFKSVGRNLLFAGIVSGVMLGVLYSTKIHALAIVAATNVTLLAFVLFRRRLKVNLIHLIASVVTLNASFIFTALALRYAVYGTITPIGIDPSASFISILLGGYGTGNSLSLLASPKMIGEVLNFVMGQVLFLSILFILPIMVTLYQLWSFIRIRNIDIKIEDVTLCLFNTTALLALLGLSVKSTIIDFQTFNFLHSRYFNFIFPIFIINYFAFAKNPHIFKWFRSRWFLALSVTGSILLVVAMFILPRYKVNLIDQAELDGIINMPNLINGNNNTFYFVVIACMIILLYHNRMKQSQGWMVGVFIIGTFLISHYYVFVDQAMFSKNLSRYQAVSSAFSAIIPTAEHNSGLIIASSEAISDVFIFEFDGVPFHKILPAGSMVDALSIIPSNVSWIMTTDPYCVNIPLKKSIVLYDAYTLDFIDGPALQSAASLPAPISQFKFTSDCSNSGILQGFYDPEIDGTWSQTDSPQITLSDPIKGKIQLELSVAAFGSNADHPIEIEMGDQKQAVTLSKAMTTLTVTFTLSEPTRIIKFNGIQSTSAAALGTGSDPRSLGIKIYRLVIRKLPITN